MFYAVVDRDRYQLTLNNECVLLVDGEGRPGLPHYFSITGDALREQPWRTGYVYLLPTGTFVAQPAETYTGRAARPSAREPGRGEAVRAPPGHPEAFSVPRPDPWPCGFPVGRLRARSHGRCAVAALKPLAEAWERRGRLLHWRVRGSGLAPKHDSKT
jgi:hypothetical protein